MKTLMKQMAERLSRVGRGADPEHQLSSDLASKLAQLREDGYVMFDHLVGSAQFEALRDKVKTMYEHDLAFSTPCLAQSRIDFDRDADFIRQNFLVSHNELELRDLVFHRDAVSSYEQVIADFAPSTLTLDMPRLPGFYDLWLDENVLQVIEAYMGFAPVLREAYIRRNFPCQYTVMNHKWHRDTNHQDHLLKAFIFFTDCDLETGAHHFVAGSVKDTKFREQRYFEDAEVNAAYPVDSGKQIISTVPAGTIILEDTRGLHKAGIPQRDYRDLGFAVFVPGSVLHRGKAFYNTDHATVGALSPRQQRYIPSSSITK